MLAPDVIQMGTLSIYWVPQTVQCVLTDAECANDIGGYGKCSI